MGTGTRRHWGIFLISIVLLILAGCGQSDTTTAAPTIVEATSSDCGWFWTGGPEVLPAKEALQHALAEAGLNGRVSTFTFGESNCVKFDAETFDAKFIIEVDATTIADEARLAPIAVQLQQMATDVSQKIAVLSLSHTRIYFVSPDQQCMWDQEVPHCKLYPRDL